MNANKKQNEEQIEADAMEEAFKNMEEKDKKGGKGKPKPKPKPPRYEQKDLKRWLGHTRYKFNGTWYILIANLVQDAWLATPELPDYPFHTLNNVELEVVTLTISSVELAKARQEQR